MIVYTSAFALAIDATEPLTKARILYQNRPRDLGLTASAVTVSGETTDGPRDAPLRADTAEYWLPPSLPATWTVDLGALYDVNALGVAGHTLGTAACALEPSTSPDGVTYTVFAASAAPADNTPLMYLDSVRNIRYVRFTMTGLGSPGKIGAIYIGKAISMPEQIEGPYTPITMARQTELRTRLTRGGQFLGMSVKKYGAMGKAHFKNLSASFMRSDFNPFIRSAGEGKPYFFAWCPQYFPLEIGYCWSDKDIQPAYQGMADLMEVTWSMDALGS